MRRRRCLAAAAPAGTAGARTLRLRGGVKGDGDGRVGVDEEEGRRLGSSASARARGFGSSASAFVRVGFGPYSPSPCSAATSSTGAARRPDPAPRAGSAPRLPRVPWRHNARRRGLLLEAEENELRGSGRGKARRRRRADLRGRWRAEWRWLLGWGDAKKEGKSPGDARGWRGRCILQQPLQHPLEWLL
jgi:hypothetical protein